MEGKEFLRLTGSGTSQEGRVFPALDFNYAKIDEQSFEDLLVFAGGFSKLINFYNHKNKIEGDWSDFLTDESVILATIIASDPSGIEIQFKKNIQKAQLFKRRDKKVAYLKKCINETYEVALRFQSWLTKLKAIEVFTGEEVAIRNEISSAIYSKLSLSLKNLYDCHLWLNFQLSESERQKLNFLRFDAIWNLNLADIQHVESETSLQLTDLIEVLNQSFQEFYETLLYLKMKAPDYFAKSLKTDTHYPEIALFLSFLKLFRHAQDNLNDLSKRHLDFYFQEVLKQQYKEPVRDKVYLKFSSYDTAPVALIKKGAAFLAGEDGQGNEVIFESDFDLLVNKAKIQKLRTIFIPRKYYNVKGAEKILLQNILSSDIPLTSLTRTEENNFLRKTFATFGEDQQLKGQHEKTMSNAVIGFAISSPILFLKEGYRDIELTLQFSASGFYSFMEKMEDIAFVDKNQEEEVFVKCFLDAFFIDITTDEGWFSVKKYVVSRDKEKFTLSIGFDLEQSDPSITHYDTAIHEGTFQVDSPVLRFRLNSDSHVFSYSFLKDLILEEVSVKTNVKGVRDLVLFNNLGQLNQDNPFYPFGSLPNKGSYLIVGSNEALQKSLDSLHLNIEWFDLPSGNSGFYGHYADYKTKTDNTSFEAKVSVLEEGRWKPSPKEQQVIKLFRSEGHPESEEALKPKSALDELTRISSIEINKLKQAPDYSEISRKELNYSNTSKRGFIKLELSNPEGGFGHTVYPAVLSEKAIKNSRAGLLKFGEKKMEKMPNPPYTPQIKSISLDYSSSAVISLKDRSVRSGNNRLTSQFYHLHPFGEQLVFPDNSNLSTFLLPDYAFEGSLMIGFSNLNPPQSVSILFELFDEYTVSSEEDPPVIEWSFLANNKWYPIKPSRILRDETNGFIRTGIIEIDLPYEINRNNTILDSSLYWVRAVVLKNIGVASNIVSVYTQVLSATLSEKYNLSGDHLKKSLPAFSINRSVENIEGIESIVQPLQSFNGRGKEDSNQFYTRVAERLRHKNRAIMSWDYERLILEKFPSVYKAACLPNMTSNSLDAPGSVLIVICPQVTNDIDINEPMASSELLYKIKNYVSSLISPFVRLEVRNPGYERIKIICSVKFTDGYNYGFFLQKLNEELKRYLSKSTEKGHWGVNLGGKVNVSDILSFMRTLPYVDFITRFSMVQAARDFNGNWVLVDTAREGEAKSDLRATKPWSILVPAVEHQITVLNEKLEERSLQAGIDLLELGSDFIIEE